MNLDPLYGDMSLGRNQRVAWSDLASENIVVTGLPSFVLTPRYVVEVWFSPPAALSLGSAGHELAGMLAPAIRMPILPTVAGRRAATRLQPGGWLASRRPPAPASVAIDDGAFQGCPKSRSTACGGFNLQQKVIRECARLFGRCAWQSLRPAEQEVSVAVEAVSSFPFIRVTRHHFHSDTNYPPQLSPR